jgi:hypothetical protein
MAVRCAAGRPRTSTAACGVAVIVLPSLSGPFLLLFIALARALPTERNPT